MSDWRLPEVTEEEVIKTLKNIKLKKGPGQDNITTDMMIKRGGKIRKLIKTLINKYLQQGKIPDTWKSVKVKLEQADFSKGYSTANHLLTVKLLMEKCNEYHFPSFYISF